MLVTVRQREQNTNDSERDIQGVLEAFGAKIVGMHFTCFRESQETLAFLGSYRVWHVIFANAMPGIELREVKFWAMGVGHPYKNWVSDRYLAMEVVHESINNAAERAQFQAKVRITYPLKCTINGD